MPKIADIIKDSNLTGTDCVIGTEALTNRTISIPLNALSTFIGDSGDLLSQSGIQVAITDNEAFRESIDIRALTGAEYDALVLVGTDIDGGVQSDTLYNVTDEATDVSITQEGIQLSITDNEAFRASIGAVSPIIGFTESNEPSLTNNVPKWSSTNQLTWSPDILGGDGGGGSTTIGLVQGLVAALDAKVDDTQVLTDVPLNAVFTDTDNNDNTQLTNTTILPVLNAAVGSIGAGLLGNAPNTQRTDTEINNLVTTRVNTTFVNNLVGVDADLINGNTVGINVPSDAVFTDTTYDTTNFLAANTVLGPLAGFAQVNIPTTTNSVPKFSAAGQITWSPDIATGGTSSSGVIYQPTDSTTIVLTEGDTVIGSLTGFDGNVYRIGANPPSLTSVSNFANAAFILEGSIAGGTGTVTQASIEAAITDDPAFRTSIGAGTSDVILNQTNIEAAITDDPAFRTAIGITAAGITQDSIETAITDDVTFRESISIVSLTETEYEALTPDADTLYNVTGDETELNQNLIEDAIIDNAAFRESIGATATVLTQDNIEAAITDDGGFLESIGAGVPVTQLILENTITNDANFRAAIGAGVPLTQTTINAAITDETAFRTSIGAGLPITQARVETSITDNAAFRTSIGVAGSVLSSLTAASGLAASATLAVNTAYASLSATTQFNTYTFPDGNTAGDRIKCDQLVGDNAFEVTIAGKLNSNTVVSRTMPMNSDYALDAEWTGSQWFVTITASLLAGRVGPGLYPNIRFSDGTLQETKGLAARDFLEQPTDGSTLTFLAGNIIYGTNATTNGNIYRTLNFGTINSASLLGGANFELVHTFAGAVEETGMWTPSALLFTGTDGSTNFATAAGRYNKIGGIVSCSFQIAIQANTDLSAITLASSSLPFNIVNVLGNGGLHGTFHVNDTFTNRFPTGWIVALNGGSPTFIGTSSNSDTISATVSYSSASGLTLNGGFSYETGD